MNLHQIVSGAIGTINPFQTVTIQASTGNTDGPDGTQVPAYTTITATAQVQALTERDIYHLESLNIQGVNTKIYLNGNWNGIIRVKEKGGDLITLANGDVYLVTAVLEQWPDWTCCALTLQLD